MRQEANLILYRGLKQGKILEDIVWIMENYHKEQEHCREIRVLCCESLHNLIEL